MIAIGSYTLPTNVIMAPLAGVSDLALRLIVREHGARICFFEMIDANSIVYARGRKTRALMRTHPDDTPTAAQVLGDDPAKVLEAARVIIETVRPPFLDLNAACPVRKVVRRKCGAQLLTDPDRLFAIIRTLAAGLEVPITVKLRTGYDRPDQARMRHIARGCEESGAAALFVHGRTKEQLYSGEVDYDSIRAVKGSVTIPVFGSGNVFSGRHAREMIDRTGCDGVLAARGALGNPWIFREIEEYLRTGTLPLPVPIDTKVEVALRHLAYMKEHRVVGPRSLVGYMRKYVMWYSKGMPHAARIRRRINTVGSYEEMVELVRAVGTQEVVSI